MAAGRERAGARCPGGPVRRAGSGAAARCRPGGRGTATAGHRGPTGRRATALPALRGRLALDLGLEDATAVVTGGSKGMGRAIAERLAAEGARVAVLARGREAIDETVTALHDA